MKKKLLFLTISLISISGFSQEIPNGNFKTFTGGVPDSWTAAAASFTGSADGALRININPIMETSDDDSTSVYVTAQNVGTVQPGAIVSGTGSGASVGTSGVTGGFPATERPKVLSGFAKYSTAAGNHGGISIIITRWNGTSRDTIGGYSGGLYSIDAGSTFEFFNIPITYNTAFDGDTPDSAQIVLTSSIIDSETATVGDTLFVDLLRFSSCAPDPSVVLGSGPVIVPNTPGIKAGESEYKIANGDSREISYTFTASIPNPATTSVLGFPIAINPLDSIQLNGVSGMPPGLSVTCGHPSCTLYGNSIGCYTISGTLPSDNDVQYKMYMYQTTWGWAPDFANQAFGNGYIQEQGQRVRDTITITVGTAPAKKPHPTLTPGPALTEKTPVKRLNTVDGGVRHSLFICEGGTVMACGQNTSGELGNGTVSVNETTPVPVSNLTDVISVGAGLQFSIFLKDDGTVWACGDNSYGQLGDGTKTSTSTPQQVQGIDNVVSISCGFKHALFVKSDGTVWAVGANIFAPFLGGGMLGDGTQTNRSTPVRVKGLSNIVAAAAGASFSMFLDKEGYVYACGSNYFGQAGTGGFALASITTPQKVSLIKDVRAIAAGFDHCLYLKNDGTVYGAGLNITGEFADGTTSNKVTPKLIPTPGEIIAIDAGSDHFLYLRKDGTVWGSGINGEGELGDGTHYDKDSVVQTNISGVSDIAAGDYYSFYIKSDSTVWGSGLNTHSQLGDGTFTNKLNPIQVSGLCTVDPDPKKGELIYTSIIEDDNTESNLLSLYPNPSNGSFYITSITSTITKVEVYNTIGELVYTQNVNSHQVTINLNNKTKGTYVIKTTTDKGLTINKLVLIQ